MGLRPSLPYGRASRPYLVAKADGSGEGTAWTLVGKQVGLLSGVCTAVGLGRETTT
jgi:hypothetical protein